MNNMNTINITGEVKSWKTEKKSLEIMILITSELDDDIRPFVRMFKDEPYVWVKVLSNSVCDRNCVNTEYEGDFTLKHIPGKNVLILANADFRRIYDF